MFKALLGLPERQALLALLGQRDRKAILGQQAPPVPHQLLQGLLGLLAQQEIQALLGRKETRAPLGRKASRVFRAFKEMSDLLAQLDRRVTPAPLALPVRLVLVGLQAPLALPDLLALKAQLARLVLRAMLAPPAPQVLRALLVLLGLLDPRALRVMLGLRAPRAFKVFKAFKVILALPGRQVLEDRPAPPGLQEPNQLLLDPPGLPGRRVALGQQGLKVMLVLLDPRVV